MQSFFSLVLATAVLCASVSGQEGRRCGLRRIRCEPDECCIQIGFIGWCSSYLQENEPCRKGNPFQCPCATGLSCERPGRGGRRFCIGSSSGTTMRPTSFTPSISNLTVSITPTSNISSTFGSSNSTVTATDMVTTTVTETTT